MPKKYSRTNLLHQKIQNTFHHCMSLSIYIEVISNYIKQRLLENMWSSLYSFYTDETSDVISTEQLGIYATFWRNQSISKRFIGLIPISKDLVLTYQQLYYVCTWKFCCYKWNESSTGSFCLYEHHKRQFWWEKWTKKTLRA